MIYLEKYRELTCLQEKIHYINSLFDIKEPSEYEDLIKNLLVITKEEENVILNHDIVFLIGHLNMKNPSLNSSKIAEALIKQYKSTSSIVLKHEIVESLGNFITYNSISFLNKIIDLGTEHSDILETAKISLTKIHCYQQSTCTQVEPKVPFSTLSTVKL